MDSDKVVVGVLGCIGGAVVVSAVAITAPLLYALGGYFTGWILSGVFCH